MDSTNIPYQLVSPKVQERREEILMRLKERIDCEGGRVEAESGNQSLLFDDGQYYFNDGEEHYRLEDLSTDTLGEYIEDQFFFEEYACALDENEYFFLKLHDEMVEWLRVYMADEAKGGEVSFEELIPIKYNYGFYPLLQASEDHKQEVSALISYKGEYYLVFSDQIVEAVIKDVEKGVNLDKVSVDDMAALVDHLFLKWIEKHPVFRHVRLEYFNADFHEQNLHHLDEDDLAKIQMLFEKNNSAGIRQFIDDCYDSCDNYPCPSAWWYDEPYNLHLSIEVDGVCIHSGHASDLVNDNSMIGNDISSFTSGNEDAESMLSDKGHRQQMCIFDCYLSNYGQDEQWVLIESLEGECERGIEFNIYEEFDVDELKFVYDTIANPDNHFANHQIFMDRVIYGNNLYGDLSDYRCNYNKDKFVLAKINVEGTGGLSYVKEIVLK